VLWLTPAMDRLFTGSAGDRRRFLDRLVLALEPGHAHHAARYEAAMRARNKLLAEPEAPTPSLAGRARSARWPSMARRWPRRARGPSPRSTERLAGARRRFRPRLDRARRLGAAATSRALKANRGRDAAAGRATEGPHRQDLAVTHRAKAMPAARGSTGEQKALLLGLVLAHAELVAERRGEPPILLLDEVAAHLDPRRAALFAGSKAAARCG
jgi:DNA replication and repair protein RecF